MTLYYYRDGMTASEETDYAMDGRRSIPGNASIIIFLEITSRYADLKTHRATRTHALNFPL
jgi:hypothetical protein